MWWSWRKKVRELEEGLEKVQKDVRAGLADVVDVTDRAQRILGRLNKRLQADRRTMAEGDEESPAAEPRPTAAAPNGATTTRLNPLTGKPLDPVSARILARRGGG